MADAAAMARPMNRRQLFLASGLAVMALGSIYRGLFAPSFFELTFDQNLARYPLAASFAKRDPVLKTILLRRTEAAYNQGGWRAANGALRVTLVAEVEVYADDERINAISRADLALLLKLENNPRACKAYLLGGAEADEFPDARQERAELASAHQAALENGFDRQQAGAISWAWPSDDELIEVNDLLSSGPAIELTYDERRADERYLNGDATLTCSAHIKKEKNLAAMSGPDAAHARRILLANTGRIDVGHVLSKLCRDQGNGLACS
jgi:hypothetical protein